MRIRRLEICGFKSFMDRVVFSFDDGITGIVGPNGCGKSNVVDAIRWAMGEQSAKHLRGRAMEDVIFNGSETKAPLGMAEVTLTFTNDRPELLPPQYQGFSEIAVTRRLFRNGESEYAINKTPCRLLDVTELFLGTGVGTKAYSIIEQGRIGLIVSAKPEDRRALIEEAAGITRYKSRRRAAERKMELTEQNLVRVGDLVSELGRRLESLNRQARKAEKYKRIKAEMKEIELHAASLRFLELTAVARAARQALDSIADEERALAEAASSAEAAIDAKRQQLAADEQQLVQLTEQAHRADNELQVGQANLEADLREIEQAQRRAQEGERELGEIAQARAALQAEHAALLEQKASLDGLATGDEKRMLDVREELAQLSRQEQDLAQKLEHERALLVSALSRIASGKSKLENLAKQREDLAARLQKALAEREALQARAQELERCRAGFAEKLGTARQMKLALEQKRAGEEAALQAARRELMESEAQLIATREELADRRSRLASLREIERNYEGYGRGVRAVMAHVGERPEKHGVLGLVSDLLRVPEQYEQAIEAALGDRLQTIVVADKDRALELATWLKEAGQGRSAFLPAGAGEASGNVSPPDLSVPGVIAGALELVQFGDEVAPLMRHLLGDVVVVNDLKAAVAYSRTGRSQTVVTLDGEVIEPTGGVVGGTLEGAGVGALHKRREAAELEEKVSALETEYHLARERQRRLTERIAQIEGALQGLSQDTHSEAISVVEQEKDLHKASEDLAETRERLDRLAVELEGMQRALSEMAAEETAAAGQSAQAESDRDTREARVRELSQSLAEVRARLHELTAERTDLQVKVAAQLERREAVEKNLSRVQTSLAELAERHSRLERSVKEARTRAQTLQEKVAATKEELEALSKTLAELREAQRQARSAFEEQTAQLRNDEAEARAVQKRHEDLQGRLSEHSFKERECALELAHLCDALRDRYAVELTQELSRFHLLPPPSHESEEKLRALREQVERMGEINLTAIEEHAQLAERHAFLTGQKKDLEQSLAQLKRAIVRINKNSRERFQQTFEAVNEKFQQVFPRLFNGGRAGLVLQEAEDGGEPGIEILAQPPGKKLQSVSLLSGGEKALTAVSLIFAIFLIKPTPFCLLDEVDAPLDEANVGRYNELVREMSQLSQFILITHNKRTMQAADTMYGITMEEPGISKIVSVKISERAEERSPEAASA